MARYTVEIEERYVYQTTVEAESKSEAVELVGRQLVESNGPESAFGHPAYGDTEIGYAELEQTS